MKRCGKCKETKPFGMFSRDKGLKDGYKKQCKACNKAYYEANKEKIAERMKAYKAANKDKIAERMKAYYEVNKEKINERNTVYYEANKEKLLEQQKAYKEANKDRLTEEKKAYKQANKEKLFEYHKAYREANKEKAAEYQKAYRESNKENLIEQQKAYYKVNKEKFLEYSSRRRARKRNAIPKFLRDCEIEKQRLRDTFKLRQLFSDATGIEHHVDHMWPLSKGGPHWSGNLQILTSTENLSKSDKLCKELKKNIKASLEIARKEYNNEDHSRRVD